MKTVSFQGDQLTSGQRRNLEFQQRAKQLFLESPLQQQVQETIKAVDALKEQGIKPERIWFPERQETGTICIAEWMGF